jgi:hypothetical protein
MARDHLIAVRVPAETKAAFRAAADRQGLSESALLKRLLDVALLGTAERTDVQRPQRQALRHHRLYVRLNETDRRLLSGRAEGRELRPATYVSLLVRAHLHDAAPLPTSELAALKESIAQVAAIGRNLNQYVRAVQGGAPAVGFGVENGKALIRVCDALHDGFKRLLAENAASWRAGERRG